MTEHAYVGREPECGCVTFLTVDAPEPERKRETAKEIARLIRDGCSIERVTVEAARELDFGRCEHWLWKRGKRVAVSTEPLRPLPAAPLFDAMGVSS